MTTQVVAAAPAAAQQGTRLGDVPDDAYFATAVAELNGLGVFEGTLCLDGTWFCPSATIDRKTMAVWLVRILDGRDPAPVTAVRFYDVDADSFYAPFVERMADLGVTQGCGDGRRFCPGHQVSRAQMAVFLSRAYALPDGPYPGFADVPRDAWYAANVSSLAASGITAGCQDGTVFCPESPTRRAEMATFLARAEGLVDTPASTHQDASENSDLPRGHTYRAVTAGDTHTCGLRTDNTIVCWGHNTEGQADAPSGTFKAVSAGSAHTCGLHTDDTITCWGFNGLGQADAPSGTFKAVSAGSPHTCGLHTDDTITCWGFNGLGQADAPSGTFKAVSAGSAHTCGLHTDDTITCWGHNTEGQADAPSGTFKAVSAGSPHTCGLHTDNTITCWRLPSLLGVAHDPPDYTPSGTFKSVTAGGQHGCGLRTDDTITCWGEGHSQQRAAPSGPFSAVTAGSRHTCGLRTDDTITCWGDNTQGQADPPGAPPSSTQCTLAAYDQTVCWGPDYYKLRADAVAEQNPGVFLTQENEVSRYIKHDIVDKYAVDSPWLMEVWNYTNRPDFRYQNNKTQLNHVRLVYGANRDSLRTISAILLNLNSDTAWTSENPIVYYNEASTALHEMAHIFTLATGVASHPAPIGIANLYFHQLAESCAVSPGGHELFADAAAQLAPIGEGAIYWVNCAGGRQVRVTPEAIGVTKSAFSGEMPQWLYDTFQKADGSLDHAAIWSAVRALNADYARDDLIHAVVYQLKDAFGGYCSNRSAFESAFGNSSLAQPWRDGGC